MLEYKVGMMTLWLGCSRCSNKQTNQTDRGSLVKEEEQLIQTEGGQDDGETIEYINIFASRFCLTGCHFPPLLSLEFR